MRPPPLISSEPPPLPDEPLPEPPLGVTCNSPAEPNRVGPLQRPLNFVHGKGYIVLRGVMDAKDFKVGWGKVTRPRGSGHEKRVGKIFQLPFNAGLSLQ